jgi:hypothetical protein
MMQLPSTRPRSMINRLIVGQLGVEFNRSTLCNIPNKLLQLMGAFTIEPQLSGPDASIVSTATTVSSRVPGRNFTKY